MDGFMEQAGDPSLVYECCNGLTETKQSWALQDHGYMIWAPEDAERLPRTSSDGGSAKAESASRTLVWWDTETCPAPITECNAWDDIAHHLMRMLALQEMSQREAVITCIAYGAGDVSEPLLVALKRRGIVVHRRNLPTCTLPGTTLSMKSMIVDILFWALNNAPPAEVRIMSATNEPNFWKLVRGLHRRSYDVFLASSFPALLRQPATGNGEYFQFSNFFGNYEWESSGKQIPEADDSTLSLEELQLLHNCLISEPGARAEAQIPLEAQRQDNWTSMAHWEVMQPRPTYKNIASGGELSNGLSSSLWKEDSKAGTGPVPRASMDDVRGWLESFVQLEDSLYGMNISLMSKSFDRRGMKLDLKHLGCPSLSRLLLDNFSDIVRLRYPTKDCTVMLPANLGPQAERKLIADFTDLLTHLLPKRNSESPLSTIKTAFRARFHYELDHEAAGFIKLSQFLSTLPKLVRVRQCSSQGKELVICRPSVYYSKQRT